MKILVAPDSFKGSISAAEFCAITQNAIHALRSDIVVHSLPMADGGEGTTEALLAGLGGEKISCQVTGPMRQKVTAFFGYCEREKLAFMEMASASGLPLVPPAARNPFLATSYGTGELLIHALERGAERIILGLGGSATNDGGFGMLEALGFGFFDEQGSALPQVPVSLKKLARMDSSSVHPRLKHCRIQVACDVTNPLLGPLGASHIYGPQKGATPTMIAELEQALSHFADCVESLTQKRFRDQPGAGAAGGLGFALLSLCQAEIKSGFDLIADLHRLPQLLNDEGYDWLITGEGRIDEQSLQGKLLSRVTVLAQQYNTPVLAFCGAMELDPVTLKNCHVFPIIPGPCSLERALTEAPLFLYQTIQRVLALILYMQKAP